MADDLRTQLDALAQKQTDIQEKLGQLGKENQSLNEDLRKLISLAEQTDTPTAKSLEKSTQAPSDQSSEVKPSIPPALPPSFKTAQKKSSTSKSKAEKVVMSPPTESRLEAIPEKTQKTKEAIKPKKSDTPVINKTGCLLYTSPSPRDRD